MSEKIKIVKDRIYEGETQPLIQVEVNVTIHADAPPSLMQAVFAAVGELIRVGLDDEGCEALAADMTAVKERRQREADNIARKLIGDTVKPGFTGERKEL